MELVPEPHRIKHLTWRNQLSELSDKQLPRCYFDSAPRASTELHGFCDTSEAAYAAVVYIRATYVVQTKPTCRLVIAKTIVK